MKQPRRANNTTSLQTINVIHIFGGGMESEYISHLTLKNSSAVIPKIDLLKECVRLNFILFNYGQKAFDNELKAMLKVVDTLSRQGYIKNIGEQQIVDIRDVQKILMTKTYMFNRPIANNVEENTHDNENSSEVSVSELKKKLKELHENMDNEKLDRTRKLSMPNVNKKSYYVPLRNLIFMTIASSWAEKIDARYIVHGLIEEGFLRTPDTLYKTTLAFNELLKRASVSENPPKILYPLLGKGKKDIITEGAKIGCFFEDSWSCYEGGQVHCGKCSSCILRMRAFILSNMQDPTLYADNSYKDIIKKFYKRVQCKH